MKKQNNKFFKRYLVITYSLLVVFVVANFVVWFTVNQELQTSRTIGDLSRLGYMKIGRGEDIPPATNSIKHLSLHYGKPIDILTIGDSFLQMQYGGYLQDISNKKVYNLSQAQFIGANFDDNPYYALNTFIKSGMIDELKPKVIILENIERAFLNRLVRYDLKYTEERDEVDEIVALLDKEKIRRLSEDNSSQALDNNTTFVSRIDSALRSNFFNMSNFRYIKTFLNRLMTDDISDKVASFDLDNDMFTNKTPNTLYYYKSDNDEQWYNNDLINTITVANDKLNDITKQLKEKGVDLYIIIPPNKLTVYKNNVVDKEAVRENFFDEFRALPKDYVYIDALSYIQPLIDAGEKDVYWADDTHWSNKTQKYIAEKSWEYIKQSFE